MRLFVEHSKCSGCRICEIVCSMRFEKAIALRHSRVRIISTYPPAIDQPTLCRQCSPAPCKSACPTQAIEADEEGVIRIVNDKCIGCRACIEACPFGAMMFDSEKNLPFTCDLCEGDPLCVKGCPTGALLFAQPNSFVNSKAREHYSQLV